VASNPAGSDVCKEASFEEFFSGVVDVGCNNFMPAEERVFIKGD
jgi:hypothetical protein